MKSRLQPFMPALCHCVTDTAQGSIGALVPFFISTLGLSYYEAGTLMFANTTVASLAQPFFGYVSDKIKLPFCIPLGMLIATGSITAMAFADSYAMLVLLCLIAGIGSALFHPEGAMLVNRIGSHQAGKAMGTFAVGGNVGFAIGPLLVSGVYMVSVYALFAFLLLGLLATGIYFYCRPGESQLQDAPNTPVKTTATGTNDWVSFSKLCVVITSRSICFGTLITFIPLYWITYLYQTPELSNTALTIFFTIGAILTYYGGRQSDKLGFSTTIKIANLILLPTVIAFTMSNTTWLSYLLMMPLAYGVSAQYGSIIVLGQQYLAKNIGFASGITLGLGVTLGGLVTPLIGAIADAYTIRTAMQVMIPVVLIASITSFFLKDNSR